MENELKTVAEEEQVETWFGLKPAARHPRRAALALIVLLLVAAAAHYWLLTAPEVTAPVVVEDTAQPSEPAPEKYFYDDVRQFDLANIFASIPDNVEADVADYKEYQLTVPLPEDAPPFYAEQLQFSDGTAYYRLFRDEQYIIVAELLLYMESDIQQIFDSIIPNYYAQYGTASERSDEVVPVPLQPEPSFFPLEVVRVYLVAEALSLHNPAEAANYRQAADDFARYSTGYGYFLSTDIVAAKALAMQYWSLFMQSAKYEEWVEALEAKNTAVGTNSAQ